MENIKFKIEAGILYILSTSSETINRSCKHNNINKSNFSKSSAFCVIGTSSKKVYCNFYMIIRIANEYNLGMSTVLDYFDEILNKSGNYIYELKDPSNALCEYLNNYLKLYYFDNCKNKLCGGNDMYCIINKNGKDTYYLAWQNPVWDESGYFWTSKETVKEILYNNTKEHPFLFHSRAEAIAHLKSINIPQKCSIIRWKI